jgi:hypothetical protein
MSQGIETIGYQGWPEALRLSNDAVTVVVVPAAARVMHYGFLGEPNVLWDNARVAGRAPRPGEWANYGGNKVWIWPQEDWPVRTGSAWPPPTDLPDAIANEVQVLGDRELRLTSAPILGYGLRTVREISLAPAGSGVTLVSRLEKTEDGPDFAVSAWTVTQVPADGALFARLMPGSRPEGGYRHHMPDAWPPVRREGADILCVERPTGHAGKLGMDADLLAWQRGGTLFVEKSVDAAAQLSDFQLGDRAQIYSHLDNDPGLPAGVSYVELEFTSPLRRLGRGDSVTLQTTWRLAPIAKDERSDAAIAARLREL